MVFKMIDGQLSQMCDVVIPGIGLCELPICEHEVAMKKLVHRHGPCTWNGGAAIYIDSKALEEAGQ